MAASSFLITEINRRLSDLGEFLTLGGQSKNVIADNYVEYYQFQLKKTTLAKKIVKVFRENQDVHMRQLFLCPNNVAELKYWHRHRIKRRDNTITKGAKSYKEIVWFPKSEISLKNIECRIVGGGLGLFANTDIYRGQYLRLPVMISELTDPTSYGTIDVNNYQFHNPANVDSPIHPDRNFESWRSSMIDSAPMSLDAVATSASLYQVKYLFNSSHLERPPTRENMTTHVLDTGGHMDFICVRHTVPDTQLLINYSWDGVPIRT